MTDSILHQAHTIIYGDREKTYGHPSVNLNRIAALWNSYLHPNAPDDSNLLTAHDVCCMMILLKVARLHNQPDHRDSQVDIAGYAALMERLAEKS